MAKPSVTADSTQRKSPKSEGNWDPNLTSTEIGADACCASLSYFAGVSGDSAGQRDGAMGDYGRYLDQMRFRSLNMEQGCSTWFKSDFERGT
jgi:hypothetical protein